MPLFRKMKRKAYTLVEVLIALSVLMVLIPVALGDFGTVFAAGARLQERAAKAAWAEWWFNRLESPASPGTVDAAPRGDGQARFSWQVTPSAYGALRVTLSVTNGVAGDVPFTQSRVLY
jgi:hypothetical protein